jgi:radical SAM superfamily enzyme YgiQ (UPF0313 family)
MKKILFIHPKFPESFWTLQDACDLNGRLALVPPVSLATIAALTPSHYEMKIVDECVEPIDFEQTCDIVAITGYTVHEPRMIEIAKAFKKRGKLVVAGGPFCSSHVTEAVNYFDVVFVGESERIWPQFLEEWEQNAHQKIYEETEKPDLQQQRSPIPRYDMISFDKYVGGMVQTSRGCPYDCEFCDVTAMFGRKIRHKPVEQVMEEIKIVMDQGVDNIFLADDNLVGNRAYVKKLLKELIRFNHTRKKPIAYITQLTLNCADDDELLDLIHKANFACLFIGVETPKPESLLVANKGHNLKIDMRESIRKIHAYGIVILPGMMIGFDTDDITIFKTQEEFLKEVGLMFPMMGMILALKGTKLWTRLKKENRVLNKSGNQFMSTNIVPKLMTNEEIDTNYAQLLRKIYSIDHFKACFQSFIEQIDVQNMKKNKGGSKLLSLFSISLVELFIGLKAIWAFLISGKEMRRLSYDVLKMCIKKDRSCIPTGIFCLIFFFGLNRYVGRIYSFDRPDPVKAPSKEKKVI